MLVVLLHLLLLLSQPTGLSRGAAVDISSTPCSSCTWLLLLLLLAGSSVASPGSIAGASCTVLP